MSTNDLSADEMRMVIEANKLTYSKMMDASLVHTRQYRQYNFSPNSFLTGSTSQAEIILGSSSDFIFGPKSYMKITVQAVKADGTAAAAGCRFGTTANPNSSAMNIFSVSEFTHRSGDQLDRTANLNSLAPILLQYGNDSHYIENFAPAFGAPVIDAAGQYVYDDIAQEKTYCIPMWLFSGLWAQEELLPGNLCGGMRCRFEFAGITQLLGVNSDATQVRISGASIVLDSYQLYDGVVSELNAAQANLQTQGLQYTYHSYHNIQRSITNTNLQVDLNYSAAQVLQLIVKSRQTAVVATQAGDSLESEDYNYVRIQARLGSLTFPRHPLETVNESYVITAASFDQLPVLDVVQHQKSNIGTKFSDYKTNSACVSFGMERSNVLNGVGQLTNNSRLLTVEAIMAADDTDRTIDTWLKHVRVVNIMLDNVTVDR